MNINESEHTLIYKSEATCFNEALPFGNGRNARRKYMETSMKFEVIDFHTHPWSCNEHIMKYSKHKYFYMHYKYTMDEAKETLERFHVKHICGSVISKHPPLEKGESWWDRVRSFNDEELKLREKYGDFYYPGFQVHTGYVEESKAEIDRMTSKGIYLMGEICPYLLGYESASYNTEAFHEIVDYATQKGVVVSLHNSMNEDDNDAFVKRHPDTKIVLAHPGEYPGVLRNIERAKMSENFYVDLSGVGLFRQHMLRYMIDKMGVERILFGSDFPACAFPMYYGGVALDPTVSDEEKKMIFCENAKRLLKF